MNTDCKDNEDEDSSTKQIIEYYQKFSQSRELPKYFSGTSVAYLPEIVSEEKPSQSNIKKYPEVIIKIQEDYHEDLELSPTGSAASNRKLEWDNLGDIGYSNVKRLHKSASLPVLTQKKYESDEQPKNISRTTSNVKLVIYPYTSSSEGKSTEKNTFESSSTSTVEKEIPASTSSAEKQKVFTSDSDSCISDKKIIEFKQSLDYLKKKIGLPDAHSTPNESTDVKGNSDPISNTPYIKKAEKPIKKLSEIANPPNVYLEEAHSIHDEESQTKNRCKEIDIALNPKKKIVNLCLTKPLLLDCVSKPSTKQLTVGVQTDESSTKSPLNLYPVVSCYKHSDHKSSSDSAKSSSSNGVASKCDSFEYVKNDSDNEQNIPANEENNRENIAKECKASSEKTEAFKDPPDSETDLKTVANDVERGIYTLQRLIKSKKYDSSTKKKYIKKILQKIAESKYLEDSSTSSDLFYPKIDPTKILHEQLKNSSFKNESSTSYQSHEEKKTSKKKHSDSTDSDICYQREKMAGPSKIETKPSSSKTVENKAIVSKKESKISLKKKTLTTSDSVPKLEKKFPDSKEIKKSPFMATKCQNTTSSDKSSSSQQSYQNWKDLQTISEKLLERNCSTKGEGDQLNQFADKEREFQLNWIDREINHLGKLKYLLEKTNKPNPAPDNIKQKITKSVYMVAASSNNDKRNYIIETKLGVGSSQQRNFRINGENYIVQDPYNQEKSNQGYRPVTADIQVLSTGKTTNIKVTTFCDMCKRAPCVCNSDLLKGVRNSKIESCSCLCTSNSSNSSSKTSSKSICINCHRSPCTCCTCKAVHDIKTCSVCHLYSCLCVISPKESDPFIGTFIPAQKEKSDRKICHKCGLCPCICEVASTKSSKKSVDMNCYKCGLYPCNCGLSSHNSVERSQNLPCKCEFTAVNSTTKKLEKKICIKCDRYPCNCEVSLRNSVENPQEKRCCKCNHIPCKCQLMSIHATRKQEKSQEKRSEYDLTSTNKLEKKPYCKCDKDPCNCTFSSRDSIEKQEKIYYKCGQLSCKCQTISANQCNCQSSSRDILEAPQKKHCYKCGLSQCKCRSIPEKQKKDLCCRCGLFSCMCQLSPDLTKKLEKESCNQCDSLPCICPSSSNSSQKETGSSSGTTSNSLTKAFVNCKCSSQQCSCDLVEKLIKHFNKTSVVNKNTEIPKSLSQDNTDTPKVMHVGTCPCSTDKISTTDEISQAGIQNSDTSTVTDKCVGTECRGYTEIVNKAMSTKLVKPLQLVTYTQVNQIAEPVTTCTETKATCESATCTEMKKTCDLATCPEMIGTVESATYTKLKLHDKVTCIDKQCLRSRATFTDSYQTKPAGTQLISDFKESATSPEELTPTIDKCIGKSFEECEVQSYNYNTNDKGTSPKIFSYMTASNDKGTHPERFEIDRGIDATFRPSSVDKFTSTLHSEVETETDNMHKFLADDGNDGTITITQRKSPIDRCTSPLCSEVEKGTDSTLKKISIDHGTIPIERSVDKCTSSQYSEVDKGTDSILKKSSINHGIIPIKTSADSTIKKSMDRGTISSRLKNSVDKYSEVNYGIDSTLDKGTTSRYSKVERGESTLIKLSTDSSTNPIRSSSVDKTTSPLHSEVDKRTEIRKRSVDSSANAVSYRNSLVDKCTSPLCSEVENETGSIKKSSVGRTLVDKFSSCICSEVEVGTQKVSTLLKETSTSSHKQSSIDKCSSSACSKAENGIDGIPEKTSKDFGFAAQQLRTKTYVMNEFWNPEDSFMARNTKALPIEKPKEKVIERTSTDVQTELRSKDIQVVGTSAAEISPPEIEKCICKKKSYHKRKQKRSNCECITTDTSEKPCKLEVICIKGICEKKSRMPKIIYLSDLDEAKSHKHKYRNTYCTSCRKCKVVISSKSSSDMKSKDKYSTSQYGIKKSLKCCCCQKEVDKNFENSTSTSPKVKSGSTDGSTTDVLSTSSTSDATCCCCGNHVPLQKISLLQSDDREFPICNECVAKRPILTTVCFAGPEDETSGTSNHTKTLNDSFRRSESFCTCKKSSKSKNFDYCPHCRHQLKKTLRSRNGIAYTLTLEDETPERSRTRVKKKLKRLEEIKMKVPNPYKRKQHKNRENHHRKDEERMKRIESGENSENEDKCDCTSNENAKINENNKLRNKDNKQSYTLQEYLEKNYPNFVDAAEYRRSALINSKIERVTNKDDLKLKFLEQNVHNNMLKRQKLFTEQEMRDITKRNYKKLPEVQQKLIDQREQKLRNADKFMADMLKRKIQNCVLKGKSSFPIDTNVINVYK